MIFIDTETTGLLRPSAELEKQPKVIEIGLIKTDFELNVIDQYSQLIDPEEALDPIITKITGLTDHDLNGRPTYAEVHQDIVEFFLGERIVVAHNCPFDMGIMWAAIARLGLEFKFPWPPIQHCTAQESRKIKGNKGKRLKLRDLHELAEGKKHEDGAHRAIADVEATIRCYKWMRSQGLFPMPKIET